MERNKWDLAIRCLAVALHANTADDEVIAAVNGFRRVAGGTQLTEMCAALAGPSSGPRWRDRLARIARANRDLAKRLDAAARQVAALETETQAAHARANEAERQCAALRDAYAALAEERRREPPTRTAPSHAPFQDILAAALGQGRAAPFSASPARFPWRA